MNSNEMIDSTREVETNSTVDKVLYLLSLTDIKQLPNIVDIPNIYQLDQEGISNFIKEGGETKGITSSVRGTNVVIEAIFSDSTLEIFNDAESKNSNAIDKLWKYVVVGVGEKVTDLKVGDKVEFFAERAKIIPLLDSFSRIHVHSALRKLTKKEYEDFYRVVPRITIHSFFVLNSLDIYLVY